MTIEFNPCTGFGVLVDRNLRKEAIGIATGLDALKHNSLIRVREAPRQPKSTRHLYNSWDVHVRGPNDRAGKCVVTLIAYYGENSR